MPTAKSIRWNVNFKWNIACSLSGPELICCNLLKFGHRTRRWILSVMFCLIFGFRYCVIPIVFIFPFWFRRIWAPFPSWAALSAFIILQCALWLLHSSLIVSLQFLLLGLVFILIFCCFVLVCLLLFDSIANWMKKKKHVDSVQHYGSQIDKFEFKATVIGL